MTKQDQNYIVVKTVRYVARVTLPAGLCDEQVTNLVYDAAESSGSWDTIEIIESDWEEACD